MEALTKAAKVCAVQDEYGLGLSFVIERLSGQCIYGTQATASWFLGYMSLICWFQAQFPQLIMNAQRSSTDGVSPAFLANWMLGDVTNLVGCLLTRQLPFQTLLATYYCFIDACLVFQYFLYNFVRRPSVIVIEGVEQGVDASPSSSLPNNHGWRRKWSTNVNSALVLAMLVSGVAAEGHESTSSIDVFGAAAAWTSSILYFTSRLPQIYKNHKRKSTEGLSVLLFMAAFTGNLFYTLSILVSPLAWPSESQTTTREDAHAFLMNALPFLIGSAGTLCFDVAIISQWAMYRDPMAWYMPRFRVTRESGRWSWPGEQEEQRALLRGSNSDDTGLVHSYGIAN